MKIENRYKASMGWYEVLITSFIRKDDPPTLMMDIGVGPKTEYQQLSKGYPGMRLVGLEPNPMTFAEVESKFPGRLFQCAITADGEPMEYVVHQKNTMASGLIPYDNTPDDAERFEVEGMTLDSLDAKTGKDRRILLWMDIEGYELEALRTGQELLASGRVRWINLETRSRWNFKKGACVEVELDEFLAGFGYRKVMVYNHYESSHHHDAIYVHRDEELPEEGTQLSAVYSDLITGEMTSADEDLRYRCLDLFLALTEQRDKVAFLRAQQARLNAKPKGAAG